LVLLVVAGLTISGVGATAGWATPAGPGPGNAPNAKACHKGGWETLVRIDGTDFQDEEECVAYGAKGGVLVPEVARDCAVAVNEEGLSLPANPNFILGTSGDDLLTAQLTAGNDVVCGFAGSD